jgi:hypothetical protein
MHAAALLAVESPRTWTSHTVLVVDQSGSMKKPDIWLTVRTALMRCGGVACVGLDIQAN